MPSIPGHAPNLTGSPEAWQGAGNAAGGALQGMLQWLQGNPGDPRAVNILKKMAGGGAALAVGGPAAVAAGAGGLINQQMGGGNPAQWLADPESSGQGTTGQSDQVQAAFKALTGAGVPPDKAVAVLKQSGMDISPEVEAALTGSATPAAAGPAGTSQPSQAIGPTTNGSNQPAAAAAGPTTPDPAAALAAAAPPAGAPTTVNNATGAANPTSPATAAEDQQYKYGVKNDEDPYQWAGHTFQQGMTDSGHSLDLTANPAGLDPYNSWLKQRFGSAEPVSNMLHTYAQGNQGGNVAQNAQVGMNAFGSGADASIMHPGQGYGDLHTLSDMNDRLAHGDNSGIDQGTQDFLRKMNGDTSGTTANDLMLAAFNQKYGSMGQGAFQGRLANMASQYASSPVSQHTDPGGVPIQYLNWLMKQSSD